MTITVNKKAIAEASKKLKNWGRWGKDEQIGTLNHIRPEDVVRAASLIRTGKDFRARHSARPHRAADRPVRRPLQSDPHHAGHRHRRHRGPAGRTVRLRYADDAINMPVQCATHWDCARPHLLRGQDV